jgi:hypothetical protein
MEYPHILNLIDDYLDRLTGARQVLLAADNTAMSAPPHAAQPTTSGKTSRSMAREKQTALALERIPAWSDESAAKSKTNKRSSIRKPKAQDSAPTLPFPQDELVLQEPTLERPHEEEVNGPEEALPQVVLSAPSVLKVRAPRRPSGRSKATTVATARALGGMVSAAPVFIPAEQIRQERAQKVTKSGTEGDGSGSSAAVPLTAEMLTQRWVQGLTS